MGGQAGGEFWLGYKLHVSETCDDPPPAAAAAARLLRARELRASPAFPNLVTHVETS